MDEHGLIVEELVAHDVYKAPVVLERHLMDAGEEFKRVAVNPELYDFIV